VIIERVISSGFCGFMVGITANAIASMQELVEKFGAAPEAFLVVPGCRAFLIEFGEFRWSSHSWRML